METNDTVSKGMVILVFTVLAALIIGGLVFVGLGVFNFFKANQETIYTLTEKERIEIVEEETEEAEEKKPPAITIQIGQETISFEDEPTIIDREAFVPLTGVFEQLGFDTSFDEDTGVAIFSDNENEIILTLNANTLMANGKVQELPTPARNVGQTAMFPLVPVMRSIGYDVLFSARNNSFAVVQPTPTPAPTPVPTSTPRPAAPARPRTAPTPTPTPEPVFVTCRTCSGSGSVTCTGCNGIGGGREMVLSPGIPHEFSESGLQWWCTVCTAQTTITCGTCTGTGVVLVSTE